MFEKEASQMIQFLSNFYRENLPENSTLEKMFKLYANIASDVWKEAGYVDRLLSIETTDTLYTLPYFKIDVTQAIYSADFARNVQRLKTLDEKISYLDERQMYAQLETKDHHSRTPLVYSMNLKAAFTDEVDLVLYSDYFLKNNRLYILPEYILKEDRPFTHFHAFNIRINNYSLEKNWGVFFQTETGSLLPRHEYRDVMSAFHRLLKSDLRIKDIKEAISLAVKWPQFDVEDMLSPDLSLAKKRLYDEWMISPAKFLVSVPEEIIADRMKINILLALLDKSKDVATDYMLMFDILRSDKIAIPDKDFKWIKMPFLDVQKGVDQSNGLISMRTIDLFFDDEFRYDFQYGYNDGYRYDSKINKKYEITFKLLTDPHTDTWKGTEEKVEPKFKKSVRDRINFANIEALRYDATFQYIDGNIYDKEPEVTMDGEWSFDTSPFPQTDYFEIVERSFPEIPRFLREDIVNGKRALVCRPNYDGTTAFEVYARPDIDSEFVLIESILNDPNASEIILISDAIASGNSYYKVKAVAGGMKSLLTLEIEIV